ncbi:MAG: hypothetical protein WBG14_13530 [Rhodococcus sp. (in: high G+C Gram-positive bacteria)]
MTDRGGPQRGGRAWADADVDDVDDARHGGRGSHQPLRAQWDPTARN